MEYLNLRGNKLTAIKLGGIKLRNVLTSKNASLKIVLSHCQTTRRFYFERWWCQIRLNVGKMLRNLNMISIKKISNPL